MNTLNFRITLDQECPINDYLEDAIITEHFPQDDETYQVIIKNVDETLIESLNPDDLVEFFGIDSEFVIAVEALEFA